MPILCSLESFTIGRMQKKRIPSWHWCLKYAIYKCTLQKYVTVKKYYGNHNFRYWGGTFFSLERLKGRAEDIACSTYLEVFIVVQMINACENDWIPHKCIPLN